MCVLSPSLGCIVVFLYDFGGNGDPSQGYKLQLANELMDEVVGGSLRLGSFHDNKLRLFKP